MKKLSLLSAFLMFFLASGAQTVIDHFNIGPYDVDYIGQSDARYRLKDNVDLYEFYGLKRDTIIIALATEVPIKHAVEISGKVGANRFASREIGLEGVWKQNIGKNIYFNGGLSFVIGYANSCEKIKRTMLEVGLPLQIEIGKLNHQYASIYGSFGIAPTVYSTMSTKVWEKDNWENGEYKKSGFLIAPLVEFGGNIPVCSTIMRIGVYGTYKINCTPGDFNVYKREAGCCFLGAKIGFVL